MTAVAVLAGGFGAVARYAVSGLAQGRSSRPRGTAVVNLIGAAALGAMVGLAASGSIGSDAVRVIGTGFLGGFTTFSTWMVESVELAGEGASSGIGLALVNVVAMMVVGVSVAAGAAVITGG